MTYLTRAKSPTIRSSVFGPPAKGGISSIPEDTLARLMMADARMIGRPGKLPANDPGPQAAGAKGGGVVAGSMQSRVLSQLKEISPARFADVKAACPEFTGPQVSGALKGLKRQGAAHRNGGLWWVAE